MLYTDGYARQNRLLHKHRPDYGVIGSRWVKRATEICEEHGYTTVLDYGCGKGTFKSAAPKWMVVHEYDPAIEGRETPTPSELVVCTDVLEHIEPECIDEVMAHIRDMGQYALLVISLSPSNKRLDDGRNAHLIIESKEWWMEKVSEHFDHVHQMPKRRLDEIRIEAW